MDFFNPVIKSKALHRATYGRGRYIERSVRRSEGRLIARLAYILNLTREVPEVIFPARRTCAVH